MRIRSGYLPFTIDHSLHRAWPSREMERRSALRLEEPFPVIVRGKDVVGYGFEERKHLDNLSTSGLYVRLSHQLELGTLLFVVVRLTLNMALQQAPGVAIRGVVLRIDPQIDGSWGYGLIFARHRFLFVV